LCHVVCSVHCGHQRGYQLTTSRPSRKCYAGMMVGGYGPKLFWGGAQPKRGLLRFYANLTSVRCVGIWHAHCWALGGGMWHTHIHTYMWVGIYHVHPIPPVSCKRHDWVRPFNLRHWVCRAPTFPPAVRPVPRAQRWAGSRDAYLPTNSQSGTESSASWLAVGPPTYPLQPSEAVTSKTYLQT
jgi:hypothetical protein